MKRYFLILSLLLVLMGMVPFTTAQTPQPTNTRLGGVDVGGYCNSRNFNVGRVNNNNDWACLNWADGSINFTLSQSDYDAACFRQFGSRNGTVYAVRDGTSAIPADNWACYQLVVPGAAPSPEARAGNLRQGGLNVANYCAGQGYNASVINNGNDWACVDKFTGGTAFALTSTDYNLICRNTYGASAYAFQDQNNGAGALNWSCYRPDRTEYENALAFTDTRTDPQPNAIGAVSAKVGYEVNVRAAPDMEAPKLGRINWGSSWPLLGREDEFWWRIEFHGQVGYVAAKWVRVIQR
jgi:hypothetical protein